LDKAGCSYAPFSSSPALLHPEDPASRSTVNSQVSEARGTLLQTSCRQPGPQGHISGSLPGARAWPPFSLLSSTILYPVIPGTGRKRQAEVNTASLGIRLGVSPEEADGSFPTGLIFL